MTDGKGRTVNFKNTVLVMTSNVGSRRILEVIRSDEKIDVSLAQDTETETFRATNGDRSKPQESGLSKFDADPMKPDEILQRIQRNPAAARLMSTALSNPEINGSIRTAMNGSPADLFSLAQENKAVASFLQEIWSVIEDKEKDQNPPVGKSGLDSLQNIFKETMSQWDETRTDDFASSLMKILDSNSLSSRSADGEVYEQRDHELYPRLIEVVKEELESAMKPELLNRIDEIVVFSPLSQSNLAMIARLNIDKIVSRASKEQELELRIEEDVVERVVHEGSANADQFGARPMRRAAQRYVEDILSEAIIKGFIQTGDCALLSLAPPHADGNDRVIVKCRGESMVIEVEDASGGIGSNPPTKRNVMNSEQPNGAAPARLRVEPVQ